MNTLRFVFTRTRSAATVAIRAAAWWGPWSHCGLVDEGDVVIESLARRGGVVCTPLEAVLRRASHHEMLDLWCPAPSRALSWSRSLLALPGEPPRVHYDWGGALGIPLREPQLDARSRLYCSEHCAAAARRAGLDLLPPDGQGVTPTGLYRLMLAANAAARAAGALVAQKATP